jgi:hypothetical protein
MATEFKPHRKIALRDTGKDEKWLQAQIAENPGILGLGELTLVQREVRQSSGGRVDLLLTEPESDTMYEVEVMLGSTDPSHIIRTIEYWDVQSRKYPDREHRAVIIAEEITNRFFNVIWLLNRSLPIIAVKLDVLESEGDFLLHFSKILDIYESPELGDDVSAGSSTRADWERSAPAAMKVFDRFLKLLSDHSLRPTLNFRQDGIALAGKWNFAKIILKKSGQCSLSVTARLPEQFRAESRLKFEAAGVEVNAKSRERFSVRLDDDAFGPGADALLDLVKHGIELEA